MPVISTALAVITLSGCTHSNPPWGSEATLLPGWQTVGESAKNAIADPHTWIPLIAAGVFATGNLDEEVTEWAVEKDLLFDNSLTADEYSDDWLVASKWLVYATAIVTPSGDTPGEWWWNKTKGLTVTYLNIEAGREIADLAKKPFNRERPDNSNDKSLPSSHAIHASFRATLAARNVDAMPVNDFTKLYLKGNLYGFAALTCWTRLEANRHHPSDVLIGYSLGHFFGAFLSDAFITPVTGNKIRIHTAASNGHWLLGIEGQFF